MKMALKITRRAPGEGLGHVGALPGPRALRELFRTGEPPAIRLVEAATRGFPNQLNRCGAKAEPGASFCMRSGRAFP
jgi:hypothetical protein